MSTPETELLETNASAARRLRLQLDDLMETTFVNTPDSIEEVKLEKFLLLVSQYSDDAIKLCINMTKPTTTTTTSTSSTTTSTPSKEEEEKDDGENENVNNEGHQQQQQQQQHHEEQAQATSPSSSSSAWYSGRLPLHLACDKSAPIDVIRWLLDHDVTKHTIRHADRWGDLPIHTVCSRHGIQKNIAEIVKLLLEADDQIVSSMCSSSKSSKLQPKKKKQNQQQLPLTKDKKQKDDAQSSTKKEEEEDDDDESPEEEQEEQVSSPTLFTEDDDGNLPIHMACRYLAPPDVVRLLLEHDRTKTKESLRHASGGPYPQIPLAVACRCQAPVGVVKLLLEYDVTNQTVITPDQTTGRLPVHIALLRPSPVQRDVVKLLLDKMLFGRMEQIGIRKFKYIMKTTIIEDALTKVHERDWNVRDKLDVLKNVFETFLEQTHVMELVLWKIQCWMQVLWSLEQQEEEQEEAGTNETNEDIPAGRNATKTSISITAPLEEIKTKYGITDDLLKYKQRARVSSGWTDTIVPKIMNFLEGDAVEKILQELW